MIPEYVPRKGCAQGGGGGGNCSCHVAIDRFAGGPGMGLVLAGMLVVDGGDWMEGMYSIRFDVGSLGGEIASRWRVTECVECVDG